MVHLTDRRQRHLQSPTVATFSPHQCFYMAADIFCCLAAIFAFCYGSSYVSRAYIYENMKKTPFYFGKIEKYK